MTSWVLYSILTIGLLFRIWRIDLPLLEFYPTRQVQTAEIARNFYREELNILAPQVHYFGPGSGLFLVEFPGYNFVVSLFYELSQEVNEYWGRLVSISGWVLAAIFLFNLAVRLIGRLGAQVTLFFYSFSPLSVLISRSFQPDQWMLTLSLGAIYFLDQWSRKQKNILFYTSSVLSGISILIKLPAIIFTLPLAAFILMSKGATLGQVAIYFVISILPGLAWYLYAAALNPETVVPLGNFSPFNWFDPTLFVNFKFWSALFGYMNNLVLLPAGMILFLVGVLSPIRKNQSVLYLWLVSVGAYIAIFNIPSMAHEYYLLPILPIAAIFIGLGASQILPHLDNLKLDRKFIIFALSIFMIFLMSPPILERVYKPIDRFAHVVEVGDIIQRISKPEDLIIGSMDGGPTLVYYADRTGWAMRTNRKSSESAIAELVSLKEKGAVIFASADKSQFLENVGFSDYMYENFQTLVETNDYVIFDLTKPPGEKGGQSPRPQSKKD